MTSGVPARMMQFGCASTQCQKVSNESVAFACSMVPDAMTRDANAAAADLPSGSRPPRPGRARLPRRAPAGISPPTSAMGDFRPSLRELQRLFWRSLADAPGGGSPAPGLVELVAPRATLDVGARVGVYADAYFGRLRDVLREDFPHVAALLGPRFEETARGYLRAHPSEHPSVRHLGRMFAD